jgi:uncharacterized membrane protein YhiD involved in acid resistance
VWSSDEVSNVNKMAQPQKSKKEAITLIAVFTGVLFISALLVYFVGSRQTPTPPNQPVATTPDGRPTPVPSPTNLTFIDEVFGRHTGEVYVVGEQWAEAMARIAVRLVLAALMATALAFRPRKRILALKRNPYVSQTQILLAIVAAALMIIVGDNAARAFGIFAAVSLVRFRTNIRDPKEITVLLISLAIGLASGVGRWDLAVVLTIFSLIVLWILEWREPTQVFRSMELKVTTKNVASTQQTLRQVFKKHGFDKELRAIERESSPDTSGSIVYSVDVSPTVSTDEISADIVALEGGNVDGIEWDQKKSYSYLYQ